MERKRTREKERMVGSGTERSEQTSEEQRVKRKIRKKRGNRLEKDGEIIREKEREIGREKRRLGVRKGSRKRASEKEKERKEFLEKEKER